MVVEEEMSERVVLVHAQSESYAEVLFDKA